MQSVKRNNNICRPASVSQVGAIFCGQNGYNAVKLSIYCVLGLDNMRMKDYYKACTDEGGIRYAHSGAAKAHIA